MVTANELRQSLEEDDQPFSIGESVGDVLRNFNTGLARTLGIPRAITDLNEQVGGTIFGNIGRKEEGERRPNILPTGEQIQKFGSKPGLDITFPPGEEPDTLAARTVQNIGAAAPILPFFGLTAPLIGLELGASFGAAAGGKLLQSTEFGQKHPELARGIGELGGGFGTIFTIPLARFLAKGGGIGAVIRLIKRVFPKSEKRALRRLDNVIEDPQKFLRELEISKGLPEGELLSTAEATGSVGAARLQKTVEENIPKVAAMIEKRRVQVINQLQKQFNKTGDIADARALLEAQVSLRASQAELALMKTTTAADPSILSTRAEKLLDRALKDARIIETKLFNKVSSKVRVDFNPVITKFKTLLDEITEGASKERIAPFLEGKLGRLNKQGKLSGGELASEVGKAIKTADFDAAGNRITIPIKGKTKVRVLAAKDFLQDISLEIKNLTFQRGKDNQIRILQGVKKAVQEALNTTKGGKALLDARQFSADLNRKFTRGTVGRILGRASGETPSPVLALEDIVVEGGVKAKESIIQALEASPQTRQQIEEFLKFRFALASVNKQNNRINVNAGNAFIKKFNEKSGILDDVFPELKRDFEDAILGQVDVDAFIGVGQVSRLSPLLKEQSAAAFFLSKDPGTEMAALMSNKSLKRTNFLSQLVKLTKDDPSGKALSGLQNGFTDELLKLGNVGDDVSKLRGSLMLNKLSELQPSALKAGLFSKEEFARLKTIANIFKRIETTRGATALKGGIVDDALSFLIEGTAAFTGARLGGAAGRGIGSSLVLAGRLSKKFTDSLRNLTNDQAKELLIRFVSDKELAKDLTTKISKLNQAQKSILIFRISRKIDEITSKAVQGIKENIPRVPVTAAAPAAGSFAAGISGEPDLEDEEITRKLEALLR